MTDCPINNPVQATRKPIKAKVLNRHFVAVWRNVGTPSVEPNFFELAKQWCILSARGVKVDLPYMSYSPDWHLQDDFPDLFAWRDALSYQNPPSKVNFRTNPDRFRELIEPLDFSKPYCRAIVDTIVAEFTAVSQKVMLEGHDIVNAELEV